MSYVKLKKMFDTLGISYTMIKRSLYLENGICVQFYMDGIKFIKLFPAPFEENEIPWEIINYLNIIAPQGCFFATKNKIGYQMTIPNELIEMTTENLEKIYHLFSSTADKTHDLYDYASKNYSELKNDTR